MLPAPISTTVPTMADMMMMVLELPESLLQVNLSSLRVVPSSQASQVTRVFASDWRQVLQSAIMLLQL